MLDHHKHEHERRVQELKSIHSADGEGSAIRFARKLEDTGKRGLIMWLATLGLWILFGVMTVLIYINWYQAGDPAPFGLMVMCIIVAFPLLLLSVAGFIYPREFWDFTHSFNIHVRGGSYTDFAIFAHYVSGVTGVIGTFALAVLLLNFIR
ncbi:MAG: Hid1 family protein [Defluviitaleaceae bacterium]|nr:Hid1 family protein [Defluviitaleaceae bacterium]